jgi:hypothetical protein
MIYEGLTSEPDLASSLDLSIAPTDKALVHPVVVPLNTEDLTK